MVVVGYNEHAHAKSAKKEYLENDFGPSNAVA